MEYIKLALAAIGDCEILEPEFNFMTFGPSGLIYLIQILPFKCFLVKYEESVYPSPHTHSDSQGYPLRHPNNDTGLECASISFVRCLKMYFIPYILLYVSTEMNYSIKILLSQFSILFIYRERVTVYMYSKICSLSECK